jgi:cytochrome d ubiquinol oxidase subunit I
MNELLQVVDWSRAQFALTAMYHWLFVPLTIGLSVIVAIMESIYYRTGDAKWKGITKFWMTLFGINFACGVATGIILEFEFGTNWSNYSWFVGDIFGAPLAIEGLLAFFMEATFIAVMFFGWKKVSRGFHLASTWLTALGVSLSALWILVANAWMQYPVGMEFDPVQMRNVMTNFWAVAFSPMAINKFFHAVFSGWALAGLFVIGISCWMLWRKRNIEASVKSLRIGTIFGAIGLLMTFATGHGSAVEVGRAQPMKLAAMEGLYRGEVGQGIVCFGVLNPDKQIGDDQPGINYEISLPQGLSILANSQLDTFVPGIEDLINGYSVTDSRPGEQVSLSYADRIARGKEAQQALRDFDAARQADDAAAMDAARNDLKQNFEYFGYGYLNSAEEAVPPVGLTFYSFHVMVMAGGLLLVILALIAFSLFFKPDWLKKAWVTGLGMLTIPLVWICSQSGWIVAEVGRQPWVIQDLLPTTAAISDIPVGSVQLTFWIFAITFTVLLAAEVSIMLRYISRTSKSDIQLLS